MPTTSVARPLSNELSSRATARLRAFRREVQSALPGNVARVILFGSRARGDARPDSDYDLAVFVKDLQDRRTIDHALADTAYRHILAGVHIRPVAVPADYLETHPRDPLAMNIARNGLLVM